MGTIGRVLLLAILAVIGLFSLSSPFFMDEAFGRAFKGETPRESNVELFMRWLGYLGLGIFVHIAFGFGWRIYLPLFVLLFSVALVFASLRKRRRGAAISAR
jgi:hypothetical protein